MSPSPGAAGLQHSFLKKIPPTWTALSRAVNTDGSIHLEGHQACSICLCIEQLHKSNCITVEENTAYP